MDETQGSLFEATPLEDVLDSIRSQLNTGFPEYSDSATITIVREGEIPYFQPSTDYDVLVLFKGVDEGDLERIAQDLPVRFEHDGSVYTVHVEDEEKHLETYIPTE